MNSLDVFCGLCIVPSDSNSESSEVSDVEAYPGTHDSRMRFQKRTFSLKKRVPIPATVSIPPELHNAHNLNIQLNSSELFPSKFSFFICYFKMKIYRNVYCLLLEHCT